MVKKGGGIYKMNLIKTTVKEHKINNSDSYYYTITRTLFGVELKDDFENMQCIMIQIRYEYGTLEVEE